MPLTRFAPAPTGHLHLGHVASAIYVWGFGHAHQAKVLLRIEDHDRQRSRPEYERQLLDDLDWLGFEPDYFPTHSFRVGRCDSRQSDRTAGYASAADDLASRGLLYGCACSRQTLAVEHASRETASLGYPGTCRDRGIPAGEGVAWRVRIEPSGHEPAPDLLLPPDAQPGPGRPGDPVVRDRLGNWTYQFAVSVDDFLQGIDLVIRGRDLAPSTRLQVELGALIGRPIPARFAHHPLLMKSATSKLSKSDGDTGIEALRAAGLTAAEVVGRAAQMAGIHASGRPIAARRVADLFGHP